MSSELISEIQRRFSQVDKSSGLLFITSSLEHLKEDLRWLKEVAGFLFLVDQSAFDHGAQEESRFEVNYNLLNLEDYLRVQLSVFLDWESKVALPDIRNFWPNADWPAKELWDMFGLGYQGQSAQRIFNPHAFPGHPLLKDFEVPNSLEPLMEEELEQQAPFFQDSVWSQGERTFWESIRPGPRGASLFGLKYFEKEKFIQRAQVEIGYYHRGIEKLAESTPYGSMTKWSSKLNSLCSETYNTVWLRSVEKKCGLEISEKAQAMRMITLELDRIVLHLSCLRHATREAGLSDLTDLLTGQMESFYQLSFKLTGRRLNTEFVCLGGVAHDYPHGWMTSCLQVLKQAQKCAEEVHRHLVRSHQWMERTKSAQVTPYQALDWGLSGPPLRACGVNLDLRKTEPFYFYRDVDFQVPLGINGDSYDRFLVRIEETFQSIAIINQILDHIPGGDCCDFEQLASLKSVSGHLEIPAGRVYCALESPNGELGVCLLSKGHSTPERVRFRTPSFYGAQALESVFTGLHWDQAWMMVHSFNLDHSEVDK